MSKILIELENVVKRYGDRTVLALGRLALREGDRVGLIGENGAGKSTLFRLMTGEIAPSGGRALIDGIPVSKMPRRQFARREEKSF